MKFYKSFLISLLLMSLVLGSCNSGANTTESVIASEKTLPSNTDEIAFQRETTPRFDFMARRAVDQSQFEQTWDTYGFKGEKPDVDFEGKDVLFIGVHESGTCALEVGNIEWFNDIVMQVPLIEPDRPCTTDATPRTFVIEIDKEKSSELENLVIVQSGIATTVPFEN
ncbi:hypothetical protein [Planococcus halotolerans]|uniref:Uncharacterized protein n=1 Tax=Planococcus halotolerans TaxID=2233542 RepID=A0A365L771_9BACL|nr:hypothetical protein [Planococcus halotolerans]RAZ81274.1 hypothetical protein DP120_03025 [Planococcus halotolerans]